MHWQSIARSILLSSLLVITGCTMTSGTRYDPGVAELEEERFVSDRLFFGRGIPGGGMVSEDEIFEFTVEVIVPRFPDGFTIWRAEGMWREENGEVGHELTVVLEVIHPDDPAVAQALEETALEYKKRFSQSAVLHSRTPADFMRFY